MFEAQSAWVGLVLVALAACARTYLRGYLMQDESDETTALTAMRRQLWEQREAWLDAILFHTCDIHALAVDVVTVVGWDVDQFVIAAILGEPDGLEF